MTPHNDQYNDQVLFGDRDRFAIEIGDRPDLVDLWAAGHRLTYFDNDVYLPQFRHSVKTTLDWLGRDPDLSLPYPGHSPEENHCLLMADDTGLRERYWVFNWGPTTDDFFAHLFHDGNRLIITVQFHRRDHPLRGEVFVIETSKEEFTQILKGTVTNGS